MVHVQEFFEHMLENMVLPWIEASELDAAINFFKRHPFEAFARVVSDTLIDLGCPPLSDAQGTAPLYYTGQVPCDQLFKRLQQHLMEAQLWKYDVIAYERSLTEPEGRLRYYAIHGKLPGL